MDHTATAGSDYFDASGTLIFAQGETSKTIDLFPALSSWLLAALALAIAVTGVFRARG